MEFSIWNPLRFRGSAWAINILSLRWFAPTIVRFSGGSCLATKERGERWKITSPRLSPTQTHTHIHTSGHRPTFLSCSPLKWQLVSLMSEDKGSMAVLSGRSSPKTTQPVKLSDVCDPCTFPRKYLWHVLRPVRWLAACSPDSLNIKSTSWCYYIWWAGVSIGMWCRNMMPPVTEYCSSLWMEPCNCGPAHMDPFLP